MFKEGVKYVQYKPGDQLQLTVTSFDDHQRLVTHTEQATVRRIMGGGFYGRVLDIGSEVIKTTQPDPLHDLLRWAAWGGRAFPSQVSDHAIQLDHLAVNLISDVLPIITNGKFTSPASRGITELPSGYALFIDKIVGRGPRFYPVNEFPKFRQAQRELAPLAYDLGLEQVGQIHPDNPFGMANEWTTDNAEHFVWLDSLAAFKYEPIFRLLRYGFHEDINQHFYPNGDHIAYNRIHTDAFVSFISKIEHKFDRAIYRRIRERVDLYETLWEESYGEVTPFILKPALTETTELMKRLPAKAVKTTLGMLKPLAAGVSTRIRRNMVFSGMKQAAETGLVTEDELKQAIEAFELYQQNSGLSRRLLKTEIATGVYYALNFLVMTNLEVGAQVLNFTSENEPYLKTLAFFGLLAGGQVLSASSRFLGTSLIGWVNGIDAKAAAIASAAPKAGNVLPFVVLPVTNSGCDNSLVGHYAIRDYVAKLSAIRHPMAGGWGTQREGELYGGRVGRFLENLAVKQEETTSKNEEPIIEVAL